jgi:hypothetical protein
VDYFVGWVFDMSLIPMICAVILSIRSSPSTVVAVTLSTVSASLVIWKTAQLVARVRSSRRIAREFEFIVSSKQVWEVTESPSQEMSTIRVDRINGALKVLAKIDLEAYLVDPATRILIDSSLAILSGQLFESHPDRSQPE